MSDTERISLARMHIDDEMRDAAMGVLDSGWWIKGPESKAFAAEWAAFCEASAAATCSNGSQALVAAMRLLDIGPGDEVIVPSHTFIASATAADQVGATPVFVEIEEDTYTLDPDAVEAAITDRTAMIVGVHLYGHPFSQRVFDIGKAHGIPVLEDSAQAHGARLGGRRIGGLGDIATFSFFPSKNLAVGGDGGAIVSNREDLGGKLALVVDHGRLDKYQHDFLGSNWRLSEIQCAIGRVQLKHLEGWIARRQAIASRYLEAFADLEWLTLPVVRPDAEHVWHLFVVRLENRQGLADHLDAANIQTGVHYPIPCHRQPLYSEHPQHAEGTFPVTEHIAERILSIPVHPLMTDDEVERVITAVRGYQPGA